MEGIGAQGNSLGELLLQFVLTAILWQKQYTAACRSSWELPLVCIVEGYTREDNTNVIKYLII